MQVTIFKNSLASKPQVTELDKIVQMMCFSQELCHRTLSYRSRWIGKEKLLNIKLTQFPAFVPANTEMDIDEEWNDFVKRQRDAELRAIIREEGLKERETREFLDRSFADGYITATGVGITKVLPPMPLFGGGAVNREKKKQTVLARLTEFFNKFFGISSDSIPKEPLEPFVLANVEDPAPIRQSSRGRRNGSLMQEPSEEII